MKDYLASCVDDDEELESVVELRRTFFAESFHALCNKYCPKQQYVGFRVYVMRKSLARLHWNENRASSSAEGSKNGPVVFNFQKNIMNRYIYGK